MGNKILDMEMYKKISNIDMNLKNHFRKENGISYCTNFDFKLNPVYNVCNSICCKY